MIELAPKKGRIVREFTELSIGRFLSERKFVEEQFRAALEQEDWSSYSGKKVSIRAHHIAILPPWAFMMVMGRLTPYADKIAYGDSKDPIIVYERS